jgi:hypothetical protein
VAPLGNAATVVIQLLRACAPQQLALPGAPSWNNADISDSILSELVYVFEVIGYSVLNLFLGLFSEIGCGLGSVASAAFSFIDSAWTDATGQLGNYGILAPFVAIGIVAAAVVVLVALVFLILKLSTHEGEEEVQEVEEGA